MATAKHVENVPQTQLDTNMAKTKPVKMGWKPEQIDKISHALNSVLANYSVHSQKLRNFHWNVTGSDFLICTLSSKRSTTKRRSTSMKLQNAFAFLEKLHSGP